MIALGTTTALGVTGLAVATGDARAQASVTLDQLDIPAADIGAEDGQLYAPHLLLRCRYRWRNLNSDPASWQAYLMVKPPSGDSWSAIGTTDGSASAREADGEFTLRGAITAASAFAPEDFSVASDGSPSTTEVDVGVLLLVRDANDDTLVEAEITTTVPITVNQTGPSASLGGRGVVAAQPDSEDPTPTMIPAGSEA